jgi:hypothetical protein
MLTFLQNEALAIVAEVLPMLKHIPENPFIESVKEVGDTVLEWSRLTLGQLQRILKRLLAVEAERIDRVCLLLPEGLAQSGPINSFTDQAPSWTCYQDLKLIGTSFRKRLLNILCSITIYVTVIPQSAISQ